MPPRQLDSTTSSQQGGRSGAMPQRASRRGHPRRMWYQVAPRMLRRQAQPHRLPSTVVTRPCQPSLTLPRPTRCPMPWRARVARALGHLWLRRRSRPWRPTFELRWLQSMPATAATRALGTLCVHPRVGQKAIETATTSLPWLRSSPRWLAMAACCGGDRWKATMTCQDQSPPSPLLGGRGELVACPTAQAQGKRLQRRHEKCGRVSALLPLPSCGPQRQRRGPLLSSQRGLNRPTPCGSCRPT